MKFLARLGLGILKITENYDRFSEVFGYSGVEIDEIWNWACHEYWQLRKATNVLYCHFTEKSWGPILGQNHDQRRTLASLRGVHHLWWPILASVALGREPKESRDAETIKYSKTMGLPKPISNQHAIKVKLVLRHTFMNVSIVICFL